MALRRPGEGQKLTREGFDRIGPFHPYVVWAAILLFDLLVVLAILAALTMAGDRIEDQLWPGGTEWVTI
ncbi:hypothetical protein [Sphingomonas desiccabilis]|uniref:Uncharacterized protein n=1 Tax=Sphingomonas desiccabilis TaxID=429134 RepID=A0A4Q2IT60_9SPHN|nr:hypothetical protein [Sphingomonas desiccabilis]MBB3911550.1 hypothetical protein [Sphingomonas desiccabilis]RXZ31697.1 hypothetical protein EO081_10790 [Sphingomonas desiccabilis]